MSGVENPLIRAALCAAARPCRDNDREGKEITDDRAVVKDRDPRGPITREIRDNFLHGSVSLRKSRTSSGESSLSFRNGGIFLIFQIVTAARTFGSVYLRVKASPGGDWGGGGEIY